MSTGEDDEKVFFGIHTIYETKMIKQKFCDERHVTVSLKQSNIKYKMMKIVIDFKNRVTSRTLCLDLRPTGIFL